MDVKRTESRDSSSEEVTPKSGRKKQTVKASADTTTKSVRQENRSEVQELQDRHRDQMNQLQDRHTKQLRNEHIKQKNSIETQRTEAQKKYQSAALEQAKQEAILRQQHKEKMVGTDQQFDEQHKALEDYRKQEAQLSYESLREAQMDTKERGETAIKNQKDGYKESFDKDQKYFEEYRAVKQDQYKDTVKQEDEYFKNAIRGREGEFQNRYNENELRYQMMLEDQRLKYEEAYEKAKYDHLDQMKQFEKGEQDPFYRVKDLGAKLTSEGPFYQIAVPVPEHELKNFKVHVQPDRITVSGQRKFEDEKKYQDEKLSTNSYQTVKQEFALPTPADKDLVRREYQNGVLFVTAPKKGFGIIG